MLTRQDRNSSNVCPQAGCLRRVLRSLITWGLLLGFTTGALLAQQPVNVSMSPSSGGGTTQAFSFQISDPAGASHLNWVQIIVNSSISWTSACGVFLWVPGGGTASLSDTGSAALGSNVAPLQNNQCSLNVMQSSETLSGNTSP
jgi:hypothetical protein